MICIQVRLLLQSKTVSPTKKSNFNGGIFVVCLLLSLAGYTYSKHTLWTLIMAGDCTVLWRWIGPL